MILILIQNVMFWWVMPGGLHARAIGDAIRSGRALGRCACPTDAAVLAARLE